MKTKKVGSAGKFGARYGLKQKREYVKILKQKNEKTLCPSCEKIAVVRESFGIWKCKKCGHKFAGRAYKPAGD